MRCLDFTTYPRTEGGDGELDVMLASGSQDGYIRLWRLSPVRPDEGAREGAVGTSGEELDDDMLDEFERKVTGESGGSRQLSTKAHVMAVTGLGGQG